MLVTMLVVDLSLGLIGRTMPQMNVMQVGMSLRGVLGTIVVIIGLTLTCSVLAAAVSGSIGTVRLAWSTPSPPSRTAARPNR